MLVRSGASLSTPMAATAGLLWGVRDAFTRQYCPWCGAAVARFSAKGPIMSVVPRYLLDDTGWHRADRIGPMSSNGASMVHPTDCWFRCIGHSVDTPSDKPDPLPSGCIIGASVGGASMACDLTPSGVIVPMHRMMVEIRCAPGQSSRWRPMHPSDAIGWHRLSDAIQWTIQWTSDGIGPDAIRWHRGRCHRMDAV